MIETKVIPWEEQERKLSEKLDRRISTVLLTDKENNDCNLNRAVFLEACKDFDSGFSVFCDTLGWIQNPQADESEDKDIPFLLYDYQEVAAREIIKAAKLGYDMPIEKSRKMGMSWLVVAIIVWGWIFYKWDSLLGSQTADKVDRKGDMDSLFEKARYFIERLPEWVVPKLKQGETDKFKLLQHPQHFARISGESNTKNFGRAGRHKIVLFDEFSSWLLTDKAAWASCQSTANCRIALSTANDRGVNCYYYKVICDAKKKDKPFLRLHWSLNPKFAKDLYYDGEGKARSPWYDKECERCVSLTEVSQELDIDYEASMTGKVFGSFSIDQARDDIEYDPELPLYCGWDWGLDATAIIWFQPAKGGKEIRIIDEYQNNGKGAGDDILHYIDVVESKGYKAAVHYGDPYSGENRNLAARGNSNAGIMRRHGLVVKTERCKKDQRIGAGRNLIKKIIISSRCPLTIEMFCSWSLEEKSGIPKHDEYSHLGDAYTYYCYNFFQKNKTYLSQPGKVFTLTTGGSIL